MGIDHVKPINGSAEPLISKAQERLLLLPNAFGNDERNIVVLFAWTESPYFIHDCRQKIARRQCSMPPQRFNQPLFSKLFLG
jgi:hypothetical protein